MCHITLEEEDSLLELVLSLHYGVLGISQVVMLVWQALSPTKPSHQPSRTNENKKGFENMNKDWQDGSEGKGSCLQVWQPQLGLLNLHSRRDLTPTSFPLSSAWMAWYACPPTFQQQRRKHLLIYSMAIDSKKRQRYHKKTIDWFWLLLHKKNLCKMRTNWLVRQLDCQRAAKLMTWVHVPELT